MLGFNSPVANVGEESFYMPSAERFEGDEVFIEKAWFEIVGLVTDELGETISRTIGHLTGYLIKSYFLDDVIYNKGKNSVFEFDCISQILSDLWCDFVSGNLYDFANENNDEDFYFLNNISIGQQPAA